MLATMILVLAALAPSDAAAIHYRDLPLDKVVDEAKAAKKPVFIALTMEFCDYSTDMERKVLADSVVAGYVDENFIPLRLEVAAPANRTTLRDLRAREDYAPAFVFLGPDGKEVDRVLGAVPKERFLEIVRAVTDGNHFIALKSRAAERPDDYDAQFAYGRRLAERDDSAARDVLAKVIALDPNDAKQTTVEARFHLADVTPEPGRTDALAKFAAAYAASPFALTAQETVAPRLMARGDVAGAIQSFEVLREHDRLDVWKGDYAHLLAFNGGNAELALRLNDERLAASPNVAEWLDTRAECLSRLGRYDEAIAAEEKAIANTSDDTAKRVLQRALYEMNKRRDETRASGSGK